jgi:hypothetical protein
MARTRKKSETRLSSGAEKRLQPRRAREGDEWLEEADLASAYSFPASDPPSSMGSTAVAGAPSHDETLTHP